MSVTGAAPVVELPPSESPPLLPELVPSAWPVLDDPELEESADGDPVLDGSGADVPLPVVAAVGLPSSPHAPPSSAARATRSNRAHILGQGCACRDVT